MWVLSLWRAGSVAVSCELSSGGVRAQQLLLVGLVALRHVGYQFPNQGTKKSYDQPRQYMQKQRYYFADEGLASQGYGFSCGHVWM